MEKKAWKNIILKAGNIFELRKNRESELFTSIDLDWVLRYMALDKNGNIKLFKAAEINDDNIVKQINQKKYEK
ncbi:MAG: hypothetical protein QM485_09170 [Flavobacteriaceae bacterium]